MKLKTVATSIVILIGLGVVAASALTVWKIVKQKSEPAAVALPTVPSATLDAIRSRQQTVQDINFDHTQTGVRRNPFKL